MLSAVKVILKNITLIHDMGVAVPVVKKLAPPLVTLLSAEPEIQYVALRCINLVIQKLPEVLEHEVRVFFCKYNDPIYVKIEKLEIMVQLAREETVEPTERSQSAKSNSWSKPVAPTYTHLGDADTNSELWHARAAHAQRRRGTSA